MATRTPRTGYGIGMVCGGSNPNRISEASSPAIPAATRSPIAARHAQAWNGASRRASDAEGTSFDSEGWSRGLVSVNAIAAP